MDDWRTRAAAMVEQMEESGSLRRPHWREAFREVPRHLFVPRFIGNDPRKGWVAIDQADPGYAAQVYSTEAVLTQLDGDPQSWEKLRRDGVYLGGWPSSSSSSPVLMALILEALDVHDGQQVLEVGTGSGYNAAILCHRLGDTQVTTVDVDPALVARARTRLAKLGYRPRLATTDAMNDIPDGRYDRVEATVAVPHVPRVWIERTHPGGIILVNLGSGLISDAMFKLVVRTDGAASGTAIDDAVFFMPTRAAHLPPAYDIHSTVDVSTGQRLTAAMPFTLTEDESTGFVTLLALAMRDVQRFLTDSAPAWNWLVATDGSWVHDRGDGTIEQGGPRGIWPEVERLWRWWEAQGKPGRTRFGLTVTPAGGHQFWLDKPGNTLDWSALGRA